MNNQNNPDIDTLARTVWGEARGEHGLGMSAVANVVMNRFDVAKLHSMRYWWGDNVHDICRKPYQFSCWNDNDPNLAKLEAVTEQDTEFQQAINIAEAAISGSLVDDTRGATHYHTLGTNPKWANGHTPVAQIGNHLFYRIIG